MQLIPPLFSSQEQVLASLCRISCAKTPDESSILPLCRGLTWKHLVQQALQERLAPLLLAAIQHNRPLYGLVQQELGPISSDLKTMLAQKAHQIWVTSALREHTLKDLQRAFQHHNIPFLLCKGMSYLYTLYSDPALRPMEDMDLVVREQDRARAVAVLQQQGFSTSGQEHYCATLMIHATRRIYLDLHTRISWAGLTDIPTASLFPQACMIEPHGYWVPAKDAQLLIHIYNQGKQQLASAYVPLLSFVELDALVQQTDMAKANQLAQSWKMQRFFACSVECLHVLYPDTDKNLPLHPAHGMFRQWMARLMRQPCTREQLQHPTKMLQRTLFLLAHIDNWKGRYQYIKTRLRYPFAAWPSHQTRKRKETASG